MTNTRLSALKLRDPHSGAPLSLRPEGAVTADGAVVAPWRGGTLAFEGETYTDNFGWQWNEFDSTQLDSATGDSMSLDRLLLTLNLDREDLRGKLVLEAGAGAGRFTEQLLACGAIVCAFDASAAIEANQQQNASADALFLRASLYDLPFEPGQFDIVICMGVLQHTPDRTRTITSLARQVRPGGMLCVDSYRFTVRYLTPSYLIGRPLLSRLSPKTIRWLAYAYVDLWWPARKLFRHRWARMLGWISPISPVFYYWAVSRNRDDKFLKDWAYLDTHDFISPAHDTPQTAGSFRRAFKKAGLVDIEVQDLSKARTPEGRVVSGFYAARGRAPDNRDSDRPLSGDQAVRP